MMKLFISFSSGRSEQIAEYLYDWIPGILQHVDPWASFNDNDLPQGRDDHNRIFENARSADACLSILTPEGLEKSPWILFEPGMFYGMDKQVFVLLCGDLDHSFLKKKNHPLNGYHAYPDQKSMMKLVHAINKQSKKPINENRYKNNLHNTYHEFEKRYSEIFNNEETNSMFMLENHLANLTGAL